MSQRGVSVSSSPTVLLGCLGVKKLTPVAYDFCAVRAKRNSGMIHSFWECFAE
jgi:hypothetical protein